MKREARHTTRRREEPTETIEAAKPSEATGSVECTGPAASCDAASCDAASCDAASCDAASCDAASCDAASCDAASCDATPADPASCDAVRGPAARGDAAPYPAAPPPADGDKEALAGVAALQAASYRSVVKNTAVYGSSQVVQMLVALFRAKAVALLLGPFAMGVNALLLSAVVMIQQFASFGIFQSGIRELSQAHASGDGGRLARMRHITGRLTWVSGLLGAVLCLASAPVLSRISFGDGSYTLSFAALALALPFMASYNGKAMVMRATQNIGLLARSTMVGAVLSLVVSLPLFYFLRMEGIVPSIIATYFMFSLVNVYYERRIPFASHPVPGVRETVEASKPILKLGLVLMISMLMMVSFTFLLNSFIRHFGSIEDVGLFQAASSICVQSMVVITMTLTADYFPRLASIHDRRDEMEKSVNLQAEVATLLLVPISAVLILAAPWVVRLLLSPQYGTIVPLLRIMSLAFVFRGLWNVSGFVPLAKGDKRTYFIYDALTGHGLNFLLNLAGFYFFGLIGLGFSYVVGSLYMSIRLTRVVQGRYGIRLDHPNVVRIAALCVALLCVYAAVEVLPGGWNIALALPLSAALVYYCLSRLNRQVGLASLLGKRFRIRR